jgi:hypothetical protein
MISTAKFILCNELQTQTAAAQESLFRPDGRESAQLCFFRRRTFSAYSARNCGDCLLLGPEIFSLQARTGNAASHFPIRMAQKETDLIPKLNRMPDC